MLTVTHNRFPDAGKSTRLRVSPEVDSNYVLDATGNEVIITPFENVVPEIFALQNGYLLVTTKVGATRVSLLPNT